MHLPAATPHPVELQSGIFGRPTGRRTFLGVSGLSLAGLLVVGCGDDDEKAKGDVVLDFSDAYGVLNYAYALEQLEAAYYTQVVDGMFANATARETRIFEDIQAHEIAHREFLKAVLGDKAIGGLTPDFGAVDFDDRDSVFNTALTFENLGVSAYIGAATLIDVSGPLGTVPLEAAGDIVAVEARHAAVIGAVIKKNRSSNFAPNAFEKPMSPDEVLKAAGPFIKTTISTKNL